MNIVQLVSRLRQLGVQMVLDGDELKLTLPKSGIDDGLKQQLIEQKTQLKRYIRQLTAEDDIGSLKIEATTLQRSALSFSQQRLWFIDQLQGGSSQYYIPLPLEVSGDFDFLAAEQALNQLIELHPTLRTVYLKLHDEVVQQRLDHWQFSFERLSADSESRLKTLMAEQALRPFDLSQDVMLRAAFIDYQFNANKPSQTRGLLMITLHHIAFDGWSSKILAADFVKAYQAKLLGQTAQFRRQKVSYIDYSLWQQQWFKGPQLQRHFDYWQNQLDGMPQCHSLALDFERNSSEQASAGASLVSELSGAFESRLKAIAKAHHTTIFVVLHALVALVIGRSSNQSDVVIGTPVANRNRSEIEALVGFFVNNLVLRVKADLTDEVSFSQYLHHVRQVNVDALAYQDMPFDLLVEKLSTTRSQAITPLFQIMFSLNTNDLSVLQLNNTQFTPLANVVEPSKFDLNIMAQLSETRIKFALSFDSSIFKSSTIERLAQRLNLYLERLLACPIDALDQLTLTELTRLEQLEQHHLITKFNQTDCDINGQWLHQAFEQQVLRTPSASAVCCGATLQTLSYTQLNQRANQLAHYLVEQQVSVAERVAIALPFGSIESIVALLAVLKAGASYVAIAADLPCERVAQMLNQVGAKRAITQAGCGLNLDSQIERLLLDDTLTGFDDTNPKLVRCADGADECYVVFTSGSTGTPKAIAANHLAVLNHIQYVDKQYGLGLGDKTLQRASLAFDASSREIFATLLCGAELVLVPESYRQDPAALLRIISEQQISAILAMVPTLLSALLSALASVDAWFDGHRLQWLLCSGEPLPMALCRQAVKLFGPQLQIVNQYGPTEATITGCFHLVDINQAGELALTGKPINNTQVYLLDDELNPVPYGTIGELYFGGVGVTDGYIGNNQLTASRFMANPFAAGTLYRTGDLLRFVDDQDDDVLEYHGRTDNQIKLRGFRIELGEIEAHLSQIPQVSLAAVKVFDETLIGFYQGAFALDEALLKRQLSVSLPHYMVPNGFVHLPQMPLTANGKIDRQLLSKPDLTLLSRYQGPSNPIEQQLVNIWADCLNLARDTLSVGANFFALGGHSLLAASIVARIATVCAKRIPLSAVFNYPTIKQLAEVVTVSQSTTAVIAPVARSLDDCIPLTFAQQRLWFLQNLNPNDGQYNMPSALSVSGDFDLAVATAAIKQVIRRHEVLRTQFYPSDEGAYQQVKASVDFSPRVYDLTDLSIDEQGCQLAELITRDRNLAFNLEHDLLLRVSFIQADEDAGGNVLLFNIHHIICDGWSLSLLLGEFIRHYRYYCRCAHRADLADNCDESLAAFLPPLKLQYADFALFQQQQLTQDKLNSQMDYWLELLADAPACHRLPLDRPRNASVADGDNAAAMLQTELSAELSQKLKTTVAVQQSTVFMLMQAALAVLIGRMGYETDVVLGAPVVGRPSADLEPLIGLLLDTRLFRCQFGDNPDLYTLLERSKTQQLRSAQHGDVPFEAIVERMNPERDLNHSPLFQVLINQLNLDLVTETIDGVSFAPFGQHIPQNKYDFTLYIHQQGFKDNDQRIGFSWVYNRQLFDQTTIARFAAEFNHLLSCLLAKPNVGVLDHPWHQVVESVKPEFEQTSLNLWSLIGRFAKDRANATALSFGQHHISYQTLCQQVEQLAQTLVQHHTITIGTPVAILMARSHHRVLVILALLRIGACYVPLSEELPDGRLAYMLSASEAELVIVDGDFSVQTDVACVSYAQLQQMTVDQVSLPLPQPKADDIAYIIFTSGSTGLPKGVLGHYGALVNRIEWMLGRWPFARHEVMAHITSMAFIRGVWELLLPLCGGGTLLLCSRQTVRQTDKLWQFLLQRQVSRLVVAPSLLKALYQYDLSQSDCSLKLEHWYVSGEPLLRSDALPIAQHFADTQFYNLYGSTEVMSDVCCYHFNSHRLLDDSAYYLPIGKPIDGVEVLLCGHGLQVVPDGVIGELVVYGRAVARGYIGSESGGFVTDKTNGRLFRTGDLGKRLPNGELVCLGRIDDQLKIRGYRVELAEIRHQLLAFEGVDNAIVIVNDDAQQGTIRLLAYCQSNMTEAQLLAPLKAHLSRHLLSYMLPHHFVFLPQLPLKPNGKIDKAALPSVMNTNDSDTQEPPQTEIEQQLATIWAQLLAVDSAIIGRDCEFFALGGHSLLLVRLAARLKQSFAIDVPLKVLFESSVLAAQAQFIAKCLALSSASCCDHGLIEYQAQKAGDAAPCAFAQQRLWFIHELQGDSREYHMPLALKLSGDFCLDIAGQAMDEIIKRHQILTSVFTLDGQSDSKTARPQSIFQPRSDGFQFASIELAPDDELESQIDHFVSQPFDLANDLLLRAGAFYRKQEKILTPECVVVFVIHHIVSDAWSMQLLSREFAYFYQQLMQARLSGAQVQPLAPLEIQYADYARWQRQQLTENKLAAQLRYWQQQLEGAPQLHGIGLDHPRSAVKQYQTEKLEIELKGTDVDHLLSLATQLKLTPFMLLHGALAWVISEHSGQQDIVIGMPVYNRQSSQLEALIGVFINNLVLRVNTDKASIADYFAHVRQVHIDAQTNQDVPFETVVEACASERTSAYSPLFQICLNGNTGARQPLNIEGIEVTPLDLSSQAHFDLDINVWFSQALITVSFKYDSALFAMAHIHHIALHLLAVLKGLAKLKFDDLACLPLKQIDLLSADETAQLTTLINPPVSELISPQLIHIRFEHWAFERPDSLMLIDKHSQLSYRQVNERANQLAHYLLSLNIEAEQLIGLVVERKVSTVINMLAILKAGAAYVPLDLANPQSRLEYICQDAKLDLIICCATSQSSDFLADIDITVLNSHTLDLSDFGTANVTPEQTPDLTPTSLAYVIYTSGSTGKPKGVMQTHDSIYSLMAGSESLFAFNQQDVWCLFHSMAFDFSVWELWGAFYYGGCLMIPTLADCHDPSRLAALCQQHQISVINQTPSAFYQLLNQLDNGNIGLNQLQALRYVIFGGEALNSSQLAPWWRIVGDGVKLINMYGITETMVHASFKLLAPNEGSFSNIGRRLPHQQLYLLDDALQPVPTGAIGEICVGGWGLARGYLNQPELTDNRFVTNPYCDGRLYRSGDLARFNLEGELIYEGRRDQQVQLRGFRIEPGEVEQQLVSLDEVSAACVMVVEDKLVAWVATDLTESEPLKQQLKTRLPSYMIPSLLVCLEQLPLTTNGKTDRNALLAMALDLSTPAYVAPQTEVEQQLVEICAEILAHDSAQISINANFFDIGGHSLLAVRFITQINWHFDIELTVQSIFAEPVLSVLADTIAQAIAAQQNEQQLQQMQQAQQQVDELSDEQVEALLLAMEQDDVAQEDEL